MGIPRDIDARKYYRVAIQRLQEARLILTKVQLPAAAVYLTGYSVECILKSLFLVLTPDSARAAALKSLKDDFGHNIRRLRAGVITRGATPPKNVTQALLFVSSWTPELRYEPGPGNLAEAERILSAAEVIVRWVDGRI